MYVGVYRSGDHINGSRRGPRCCGVVVGVLNYFFFLFRHEFPEVERFEFELVANLLSIDLRPVQIKVDLLLTVAHCKPGQCVSMPRGPLKSQFLLQ